MMDSRVKTFWIQYSDGQRSGHHTYSEAIFIIKQAKLLGIACEMHPEINHYGDHYSPHNKSLMQPHPKS